MRLLRPIKTFFFGKNFFVNLRRVRRKQTWQIQKNDMKK
jgi:hypothetical protein